MTPFQYDRPTFIRIPFFTRGKTWMHGEHFPWREMNLPEDKVLILFNQGYLIQSAEAESEMVVGDGLEAIDIAGLHDIVADYNERVKKVTQHKTDFLRRKCPQSTIADKQRGLIRSWRRNNLDWLEKAEANK